MGLLLLHVEGMGFLTGWGGGGVASPSVEGEERWPWFLLRLDLSEHKDKQWKPCTCMCHSCKPSTLSANRWQVAKNTDTY